MATETVHTIVVPKETVSDDHYTVTELPLARGAKVNNGDVIGALETSKADFEIDAPHDGYIFYAATAGQNISAGEVFAYISPTEEMPAELLALLDTGSSNNADTDDASEQTDAPSIRVSRKAQVLLDKHKLTTAEFAGLTMIRESDVQTLLDQQGPKQTAPTFHISVARGGANRLLIVGDKGHAGACLDLLAYGHTHTMAGFVGTADSQDEAFGYPVLGTNDDLAQLYDKGIRHAVIGFGALGKPQYRSELFDQLVDIGFSLPNLVHPRAIIEPTARLGSGNQVFAGAVIGSHVSIGNNCIINSAAIISHDCGLADNVHLTPGATLAGDVHIGKNTIVGMNVNVFLSVRIGANVVINNGVTVNTDVDAGNHLH